jgi:hypothetical protein
MLKAGLIGLVIAASCLALLALLTQAGVLQFGPCGPDPFGLVFLLGFLFCGAVGLLLTIIGLIHRAIRRYRTSEPTLSLNSSSNSL